MPRVARLLVAGLVAAGLAAAIVPAVAGAADGAPQRVVLIGNDAGVSNGPTAPAIFTTTQPWHVVEVWTYHWNNGKGAPPGKVGLRDLTTKKLIGNWRTTLYNGVYWKATVSLDLPAGRYQFIDSDPSTWATNEGSSNMGMGWLMATPGNAGPPKALAYQLAGTVHSASHITLRYSIADDSGRAKAHLTLFDGGEPVARTDTPLGPATGKVQQWNVALRADLKGPLSYCVWAENAAGTKSGNAPRSGCKFISMLVDIGLVSNGCGGEGWDSVVAGENYFGNTSTYTEPEGGSYEVSFIPACNLHDAGYGGQTVADAINGGIVDYHTWSRKWVDDKFQSDLWAICRRRIPPSAKTALKSCIRDGRRYLIVRTDGMHFFDYNLTKPGTQGEGPRQ
jgi:hypothetical protein